MVAVLVPPSCGGHRGWAGWGGWRHRGRRWPSCCRAVGKRNGEALCHLCSELSPLSHSGDDEVAVHGTGQRGWAQEPGTRVGSAPGGAARSGAGGFGVLGGSTEAVSPCPRAARCVRMRESSLLPVLLPSARRWPGGASRGLYALLTHFLPSVSNSSWRLLLPAFFQLKKKKKKSQASSRRAAPRGSSTAVPLSGGLGLRGEGAAGALGAPLCVCPRGAAGSLGVPLRIRLL